MIKSLFLAPDSATQSHKSTCLRKGLEGTKRTKQSAGSQSVMVPTDWCLGLASQSVMVPTDGCLGLASQLVMVPTDRCLGLASQLVMVPTDGCLGLASPMGYSAANPICNIFR